MKAALRRMAATVALTVACAAVAGASEWTDETKLKFTEPVMVPGATLAPGTYTFKLLDSDINRHVVQIYNEDETKLFATALAIPIKRVEPKGDVVVKLNPTEAGAPIAIKAWYYPGTLYGHEFLYSDQQAREIAQRTKTIVLSTDAPKSDLESKGTIYAYDAEGRKGAHKADETTAREWEQWRQQGQKARQTAGQGQQQPTQQQSAQGQGAGASAKVAVPPGTEKDSDSTAPMMRNQPKGTDVQIGQLEENPGKYAGQTINVTGEVDEVFGPRLFKLDEDDWIDLDGEVLVYLPSPFAALVREGDQVTVAGTLKTMLKTDLERELGWLEPNPDVEMEFAERPVLIATSVVGGDSDVALAIDVNRPRSGDTGAVGTSGGAARPAGPVTDVNQLARGETAIVGRYVDLDNVKVSRAQGKHGFWLQAGDASIFVLPAQHAQGQAMPSVGQSVSIDGLVLEMPRSLSRRAPDTGNPNQDIYIYATTIK